MPPLRLPPSLTTQTTRRLNLLTSHTKPSPPTTIPLPHPIKPNTFCPHRTTTSSSQPTPSHHTGGCYCTRIRYTITLPSGPDSARTSLCHCKNCKKFTGGPFGVTTKIPSSAYTVTSGQHLLKIHEADNGSGTVLHREFCSECGSGILEFGVGGFPWQRSQQRQDSNDDDDDVAAVCFLHF